HPHARGEYGELALTRLCDTGSPPRTWGIRSGGCGCIMVARFTPTHVGNTANGTRGGHIPAVHPHARGEYAWRGFARSIFARFPPPPVGNPGCVTLDDHTSVGSPPRTWGIRPYPT